jgi:hypothetical protein
MSQEQLMALASERFAPGMQVLIPDQQGHYTRRASVQGVVPGLFNGSVVPSLGLMLWPSDSFMPTAYELTWALEHLQVVL